MQFRTRRSRSICSAACALAKHFVQVPIGGDHAFFQGVGRPCSSAMPQRRRARGRRAGADREARPRRGARPAFVAEKTEGYAAWRAHSQATPWPLVVARSGISEQVMRDIAELLHRVERDDRVLGDGAHAAQARGRDDRRGRELDAAARQRRQAGRGAVPGARALERAGRSHDGHRSHAAPAVARRAARRVRLRAAAQPRLRHRRHRSTRSSAGEVARVLRARRQLRLRGARHRRASRARSSAAR